MACIIIEFAVAEVLYANMCYVAAEIEVEKVERDSDD
jgi:hypothetical protein